MMLRLVRAQVLRELGRRAEAAAVLESVAAQGSEVPLHSLRACVVRRGRYAPPRRRLPALCPPPPAPKRGKEYCMVVALARVVWC